MRIIIFLIVGISIVACGSQNASTIASDKAIINTINNNLNSQNMDLTKIENTTVRQAIAALQANDLKTWYTFFTDDVIFTDDGNTLDFKSFFDNAFDKNEKFISIDAFENDGRGIYGDFFAGQWGTFKVYFKFLLNAEGMIERLDIGQVGK